MSTPPGGFARHLAALPRLEEFAQRAREATLQRFGRTVWLFAPLYVSNACLSSCTYCGFSKGLDVARRTLTVDEVVAEARVLVERGFPAPAARGR